MRLLTGEDHWPGLMPGYALGIVTGSTEGGEEVRKNRGIVWQREPGRFSRRP